MRCAIYARYSSELQNPKSADDQVEEAKVFIRRQGWPEPIPDRIYTDEAISGQTADRPGLKKMLRDAERGLFDVLVCEDTSRLSRDRYDSVSIKTMLQRAGIRIWYYKDGIEVSSEAGIWLDAINEAKAHAFLLDLAKNVRRGQRAKARKGFSTGGPPPYGYCWRAINELRDYAGRVIRVDTVLEPDPMEAPIVHEVFERYDAGESFHAIMRGLNLRGLRPRRASAWNCRGISYILDNPVYIGHRIYGKRQVVRRPGEDGKKYKREVPQPESEWIVREGAHPPLISKDLWDRVQARLRTVHEQVKAPQDLHNARAPRHLLSGLLLCGFCKGPMVIRSSGRRYFCLGSIRGVCEHRRRYRVKRLERLVVQAIEDFFRERLTQDYLDEVVESYNRRLQEESERAFVQEREIRGALGRIEGEIQNLLTFILRGESEAVREKLAEKEVERTRLKQALRETWEVQNTTTIPRISHKEVLARFEANAAQWRESGLALRRFWDRHKIVEQIIVTPDKLTVTGRFFNLVLEEEPWATVLQLQTLKGSWSAT